MVSGGDGRPCKELRRLTLVSGIRTEIVFDKNYRPTPYCCNFKSVERVSDEFNYDPQLLQLIIDSLAPDLMVVLT